MLEIIYAFLFPLLKCEIYTIFLDLFLMDVYGPVAISKDHQTQLTTSLPKWCLLLYMEVNGSKWSLQSERDCLRKGGIRMVKSIILALNIYIYLLLCCVSLHCVLSNLKISINRQWYPYKTISQVYKIYLSFPWCDRFPSVTSGLKKKKENSQYFLSFSVNFNERNFI